MGACRSAATSFITPAGPLKDIAQARELLDTWLQHWSAKGYGQWAIATREAPQDIIGFGGLDARRYLDIERVNLGYRFAVSVWGKGYATELSDAALEYGFGELGLGEIFALVRPDHGAPITAPRSRCWKKPVCCAWTFCTMFPASHPAWCSKPAVRKSCLPEGRQPPGWRG